MANFEYYTESPDFHCKYAKGRPAVSGREFHHYDEAVLFLGGSVRFVSKDTQTELQPGDIVWIAREQFHQFIVSDESSYERCIVAIKPSSPLLQVLGSVMEGAAITRSQGGALRIFGSITEAMASSMPKAEKELLLSSLITQLLFEKRREAGAALKSSSEPSSVVSRAIMYIDEHLTCDLSIRDIAARLHISESTLAHRFREELNISVYHYICKKRVSVARQHISSGYTLSEAALLAGFRDYSGFYRICKSHFGITPSELADSFDPLI